MTREICPACKKDTYSCVEGEYDIPDESGSKKLSPDVCGCSNCGFHCSEHVDYPESKMARKYRKTKEYKNRLKLKTQKIK